jgi:putative hemolysin
MDSYVVIYIIFTIVLSGIFSGLEIAFISANKLRIELENKQGVVSSKIISQYFLNNPSRFIGTMLIGNNIALVVYGILIAKALEPIISMITQSSVIIFLSQTLISTIIILFTGEFIPKALFRINPNKILSFFAAPALIFYFLLYPFVQIILGLSKFFLKYVLRVAIDEEKVVFKKIDLDYFIKQATKNNEEKNATDIDNEIQFFQNALTFSSVKARESMIPRTEIEALEVNQSIDELKQAFHETGFSRILIYNESIDDIIGYVHSYEMFKNPETIRSIIKPVMILPETMQLDVALRNFIKERKSIAIVVDEFGGTSGLLTIEDIVEEIFGEIDDEHDKEELLEKKIAENEYIFAARLEIDYINDKYKLNLPESDEYETLAGLIISKVENIPTTMEIVVIDKFKFTVLEVSDTKIERVKIELNDIIN